MQSIYAVWTPDQLASHRRAAAVCLQAKDEAFNFITERLLSKQPVSEVDVQALLLERFAAEGIDPDHPPIVAVNAHAGDPHYVPLT